MLRRLVSNFRFRPCLLTLLLYLIVALPTHAAPMGEAATPHGAITGTVTNQVTGKPVPDLWVCTCRWGERDCPWLTYTHTDATGYYYLGQLPEGEYKACFYTAQYVKECYDDWPDGAPSTRHQGRT